MLRPTFRDPAGSVVIQADRVLRLLSEQGAAELDAFLQTHIPTSFAGRIVATWPAAGRAVEHPKIWFTSYPYEWPAEMLHSAGALTLDLARAALKEGWQLKDATPYNVLYDGAEPVFVDVCSFERRNSRSPIWQAYGQFARNFLNPLMAHKILHQPTGPLFFAHRDGLDAEELYRWVPALRRWLPPLLFAVTIPALLSTSRRKPAKPAECSPDEAAYVLGRLLNSAESRLNQLEPAIEDSRWTGYMSTFTYSAQQFEFKSAFVKKAIEKLQPKRTLDIGCNTGHFSRLAAKAGSRVVGMDSDPAVVGRLWREAKRDKLDIQPLVGDFARPSPATGWRNAECLGLTSRFEQADFGLTLVLGTLHHLMVTDRIQPTELLEQLAAITKHAVVEYIGPEDEMFQYLARGNERLYAHVTPGWFENLVRDYFRIIDSAAVPGSSRRLYLLTSAQPS